MAIVTWRGRPGRMELKRTRITGPTPDVVRTVVLPNATDASEPRTVPASPSNKMLRYLANSLRQRDGLSDEAAVAAAAATLQREQQSGTKRAKTQRKKRKQKVKVGRHTSPAATIGPAGFPTATAAFVRLFNPNKKKTKQSKAARPGSARKKSKKRKKSGRRSMFVQGGAPGLGKRS